MRRLVSSALPAFAFVAACILPGCVDDWSPAEGYWTGDHLTFQLKDGEVFGIGTKGISCKGDNDCYGENSQFFPGVELPISGREIAATLSNQYGEISIAGRFDASDHAEGTYTFIAADQCCSIAGMWRAELLSPYPGPVEDVSDQGDAEPWIDGMAQSDAQPGDGESPGGEYPPSASAEQVVALQHANEIRDVLGLPRLKEVEPINFAAQAHAEYFVAHCQSYQMYGLSPHEENKNWDEGFTGVNFFDRMVYFDFAGLPGWEVMAFIGNPVAAIDGWMETLYHRIPFVNPKALQTGYGIVKGDGCYNWAQGVDVMDFGQAAATTVTEPVAWPYDGQTNVNRKWDGAESPQPPLPPGRAYPSGPVITLTFPSTSFSVTDHKLLAPDGAEVKHMWVTPQNDPAKFLSDTVALYSLSPLKSASVYTVRLSGKWKAKDTVWEWSFTTGQ